MIGAHGISSYALEPKLAELLVWRHRLCTIEKDRSRITRPRAPTLEDGQRFESAHVNCMGNIFGRACIDIRHSEVLN